FSGASLPSRRRSPPHSRPQPGSSAHVMHVRVISQTTNDIREEKNMPSTQIESNSNYEYRDLPITALVESSTNPRKRFDEKSVEELAASFKAQGVLAPLLVRELDETKYEVVAGARRLRAARLAELRTVPVRVVKLSDAEAIEAQVTENLQREDIHPLEEALGFKSLLELGEPYTIAYIAARAGKSEAYV